MCVCKGSWEPITIWRWRSEKASLWCKLSPSTIQVPRTELRFVWLGTWCLSLRSHVASPLQCFQRLTWKRHRCHGRKSPEWFSIDPYRRFLSLNGSLLNKFCLPARWKLYTNYLELWTWSFTVFLTALKSGDIQFDQENVLNRKKINAHFQTLVFNSWNPKEQKVPVPSNNILS